MTPTQPESQLLKPRGPALTNDAEWPHFELVEVNIVDKQTQRPCSLLRASKQSKVVVYGKLVCGPELAPHVVSKATAKAQLLPILIDNVQMYSYGQNDEGEIKLWAAGQAGWFAIEAAEEYRGLYELDCEAARMWYFLLDLYCDMDQKQAKETEFDTVLEQYVADISCDCNTERQAEDTIQRHGTFLLECMMAGKDEVGIEWEDTAVFQQLQKARSLSSDSPASRMRHAGKGKSTLRPRTGVSGKGPDVQPDPSHRMSELEGLEKDTLPLGATPSSLKRKLGQEEAQNIKPLRQPPSSAHKASNMITTLVAEPHLSYEPGQGDIWYCSVDGCPKVVYAASDPASRLLIKEHFDKHSVERQAQIDLVLKEQRPYLPVGRLVNKIRDMAQKQYLEEQTIVNGPVYPAPIQRKY